VLSSESDINCLIQIQLELKKMSTDSSSQIDMGHWLLRLIAYVIDWIIVAIVVGILGTLFFLPFLLSNAGWGFGVVFPLIVGLLMVLYFLYTEVNLGGTLGMRFFGLRVQTVNGGKITYGQSFIRNISKIHPLLLLLDWLLGVATAGDKRQKYSDRMAGTVVIQGKQGFVSVPSPAPSAQ